jgi:hypothetical protein
MPNIHVCLDCSAAWVVSTILGVCSATLRQTQFAIEGAPTMQLCATSMAF